MGLRNLFHRRRREPALPPATGKTHDYSRGNIWGYACYFQLVDSGGMTIKGHLFGLSIRAGDWLLLPNGPHSTRYRITKVDWASDPSDMYFFEATFDPRRHPVDEEEAQPKPRYQIGQMQPDDLIF